MTQKILFKSLKIEKLETLLRRIVHTHPTRAKVERWLGRSNAGEWGERSLDYYISFLPDKEYLIFNGIRL